MPLDNHTIFVSGDGGPYTPWLINTPESGGSFTGQPGYRYAFYGVARDLTGNLERPPSLPDATTDLAVADTTPPIITPTITPTPNAAGWHNADVTVGWSVSDPESGIAAFSGCGTATVVTETASVSLTCSATNGAGLSGSASVTVKIDKTPPTVACSVSPKTLWPPNHKMVPVAVTVTTTDTLSGAAGNATLTSAMSSEADQGLGDGDMPYDIQKFVIGTPDTQGLLRAERSGRGTGRVYTLSYSSMDMAGNAGTCNATVVVPHDRRK